MTSSEKTLQTLPRGTVKWNRTVSSAIPGTGATRDLAASIADSAMDVTDRDLISMRVPVSSASLVIDQSVVQSLLESVALGYQASAADASWNRRDVEN